MNQEHNDAARLDNGERSWLGYREVKDTILYNTTVNNFFEHEMLTCMKSHDVANVMELKWPLNL